MDSKMKKIKKKLQSIKLLQDNGFEKRLKKAKEKEFMLVNYCTNQKEFDKNNEYGNTKILS